MHQSMKQVDLLSVLMGITLTYITVTAYPVWKITQASLPVNHRMILEA